MSRFNCRCSIAGPVVSWKISDRAGQAVRDADRGRSTNISLNSAQRLLLELPLSSKTPLTKNKLVGSTKQGVVMEFYGLPPIGQKQRPPMDGAQFHPLRVGEAGGRLMGNCTEKRHLNWHWRLSTFPFTALSILVY